MDMTNNEISLCGVCFHGMYEPSYDMRTVRSGRDGKVICAECGKKRFGATYQIIGAKRGKK